MLTNTFYLFILIPFILGFVTYGIHSLMKPPSTTHEPVTLKISSETMQQLKENGYLDSNTGKLKDSAVGWVNLEEIKT